MPIAYRCATCQHEGRAKDELAGRIVKCPRCKSMVELPVIVPDFTEVKPSGVKANKAPAAKRAQVQIPLRTVMHSSIVTAAAVCLLLPAIRPGTSAASLIGFLVLAFYGIWAWTKYVPAPDQPAQSSAAREPRARSPEQQWRESLETMDDASLLRLQTKLLKEISDHSEATDRKLEDINSRVGCLTFIAVASVIVTIIAAMAAGGGL